MKYIGNYLLWMQRKMATLNNMTVQEALKMSPEERMKTKEYQDAMRMFEQLAAAADAMQPTVDTKPVTAAMNKRHASVEVHGE